MLSHCPICGCVEIFPRVDIWERGTHVQALHGLRHIRLGMLIPVDGGTYFISIYIERKVDSAGLLTIKERIFHVQRDFSALHTICPVK